MNETINQKGISVDGRELFAYDAWPSRAGEWEGGPLRGASEYDHIDFHVDLGCGRIPKGRIGVDRYAAEGVAVLADLDAGITIAVPSKPGGDAEMNGGPWTGLPFGDSTIKSIISHHFFEHVGEGFLPLVDEIYRVLEPGGILRAITPLFPSWSAVADPDHRRYFMGDDEGHSTWDAFCGTPGDGPESCWLASFSVPYTTARFTKLHQDITPRTPLMDAMTSRDAREIRVALRAEK